MRRLVTLAVVSAVMGFVAHFGIFFFLKFQGPVAREQSVGGSEIKYVGNLASESDPVLQEKALLFDSAPLFMPTRWNLGSEMGSVASLREATEVFALFPPQLSLPADPPNLQSTRNADRITPRFELPEGPSFALAPFGRLSPADQGGFPAPMTVEARRIDQGQAETVVRVPVPDRFAPEAPSSLWTPAKLHLHLVEGRPLGRPVVASSSGFTDWDELLQRYLESLEFYKHLRNGYYRVTVNP